MLAGPANRADVHRFERRNRTAGKGKVEHRTHKHEKCKVIPHRTPSAIRVSESFEGKLGDNEHVVGGYAPIEHTIVLCNCAQQLTHLSRRLAAVWLSHFGPRCGRQALAEIRIFDGESIESALRRFKRQVQQEGIIKEVKKHAFFLKPGERKRLKSKLAQKLKRKKVRRSPADSDSKTPSRSQ